MAALTDDLPGVQLVGVLAPLRAVSGRLPPCDVALVRPDTTPIKSVLVPVRGGPNAELALRMASTVCRETGAELVVLHIFNPRISVESREREEAAFLKLSNRVDVPMRRQTVLSTSVREAIIREAADHQLIVLGATLSLMHRPMVLGAPVGRLLRRLNGSVMVAKAAGPVASIKDPDRPFRVESRAAAAERVDRWFAENTFHSKEFAELRRLVDLKERQGITIEASDASAAMDHFYSLLQATAEREAFKIRSRAYYQDLLTLFRERGQVGIYLARHGDHLLAGAVMLFYGRTLIYLFGGTGTEGKELKPGYLLHWRAIQDAQQRGCTSYDMWGVPVNPQPGHPGYGYYVFKSRFNGELIRYIGIFDLPVNRAAAMTIRLAERFARTGQPEFV
jgi:nucleotide-binding universal stress UspA family protein